MLSKIEVILLSVLNERPSYAYEINKTIDCRDMRRWVRIGVASIDQVLKRLEKKGLVYTENGFGRKNEKRYFITDSGRKALLEASKSLISNIEWYYLDINVGIETSDLLTTEEMVNCLTKRLHGVTANLKRLKEIYSAGNGMEYKKKSIIKNLIYMREAEEKSLREVIQKLSFVSG